MPDQKVREARPVAARNDAHEVALDLRRILLPREPQALRKAADVRVDDDALRRAPFRGDDVRGLPADSGKPNEATKLTVLGEYILRDMRNFIVLIGVHGLAYNIFIGAIILGMMTLHSILERRHHAGT